MGLQPWEDAREKTLAAEREAATAQIATAKAAQHLKAAGAAQSVAQDETDKHARASALLCLLCDFVWQQAR